MGLLASATLETMTDRLYQRVYTAFLSGVTNLLSGNTHEGLARFLDDSTDDAALEAALLVSASGVDRMGLNDNAQAVARILSNWPAVTALFNAISTYVKSADGGGYASLATYLSVNSVLLHPFVAEMARVALGEGALTFSGATVGAMPPLMQCVPFDHVYIGTAGSWTDVTTDAGDTDTADVTLFATNGDKLVLQSTSKFDRYLIGLGTLASSNPTLTLTYWNGSAWATKAMTDPTVGGTVQGGMVSWAMPADWEPSNDDDAGTPARLNSAQEGEYYTVIITRTNATLVTAPVATWLLTCPEAVTTGSGSLYGLPQPPLAIVRITGTNTCVVTPIQNPDSRFLYPGATGYALTLRALTPIAADLTFTIGYLDQAGAASTEAQSAWTGGKACGATQNISLGADSGLQAITAATCAITSAATAGAFAIEVSAFARAIGAK